MNNDFNMSMVFPIQRQSAKVLAFILGASPHVVELELDRTGLASRPERAGGAERVPRLENP